MSTDKRLIAAAASLLDTGGESAVTLRAVGHAVCVSRNAPYKHFKDRNGLLAAVAIVDFEMLTEQFTIIRKSSVKPVTKIKRALGTAIDYGHRYPARYRLLFNDPDIAAQGGDLEAAAMRLFVEFAAIVQECQTAGHLPDVANAALSGLLYASMHGLIDLEASGRMKAEKGFRTVGESVNMLIQLLSSARALK